MAGLIVRGEIDTRSLTFQWKFRKSKSQRNLPQRKCQRNLPQKKCRRNLPQRNVRRFRDSGRTNVKGSLKREKYHKKV